MSDVEITEEVNMGPEEPIILDSETDEMECDEVVHKEIVPLTPEQLSV